MTASSDRYRREAQFVERMAEAVSLRPDKEALLAQARTLRELADEIEGRTGPPGQPKRQAG
jgi:hypothetical protein